MHARLQNRVFGAKFATFQRKKISLLMHFRCILVEVQTGLGKSWQIGAVARYKMLQKIKLEAIKLKVDHLRCLLCICVFVYLYIVFVFYISMFWCQFTVDKLHCLLWKSRLWTVTDRLKMKTHRLWIKASTIRITPMMMMINHIMIRMPLKTLLSSTK